MLYPVMTQASVARESPGNDRSRAGKATFTMERSSEAMNAPRAVTTKTAWRSGRPSACLGPAVCRPGRGVPVG